MRLTGILELFGLTLIEFYLPGEAMLPKKITKLFLALSLSLCFVGGVATVASAGDEQTSTTATKGCDYDRNASKGEEQTSGDCGGTVPTPEPVSIILFSAGLAGVGFAARRRLRRSE
jgi:hypothetical protein